MSLCQEFELIQSSQIYLNDIIDQLLQRRVFFFRHLVAHLLDLGQRCLKELGDVACLLGRMQGDGAN